MRRQRLVPFSQGMEQFRISLALSNTKLYFFEIRHWGCFHGCFVACIPGRGLDCQRLKTPNRENSRSLSCFYFRQSNATYLPGPAIPPIPSHSPMVRRAVWKSNKYECSLVLSVLCESRMKISRCPRKTVDLLGYSSFLKISVSHRILKHSALDGFQP